jgi:lipopolysaccharide export LptBFGC system permease protein LptF
MILGRYIFREVISSTLLGTLLATFVVFLQKSGPIFQLLISTSAKPRVAAKVFALALPQHPNRPWPHVERWRDHRHARRRSP